MLPLGEFITDWSLAVNGVTIASQTSVQIATIPQTLYDFCTGDNNNGITSGQYLFLVALDATTNSGLTFHFESLIVFSESNPAIALRAVRPRVDSCSFTPAAAFPVVLDVTSYAGTGPAGTATMDGITGDIDSHICDITGGGGTPVNNVHVPPAVTSLTYPNSYTVNDATTGRVTVTAKTAGALPHSDPADMVDVVTYSDFKVTCR